MLKQIIHQISKLCKNSSFVNNRSYQDAFSSASFVFNIYKIDTMIQKNII